MVCVLIVYCESMFDYNICVFITNSISNSRLFFNVIVFYIVFSCSLQKVTHNKYAKYIFPIHQIDAHGNVLKELMSLSFVQCSVSFRLAANSSVNFWVAFLCYLSSIIKVFFHCYFRITRRSMLRSQDELNTVHLWLFSSIGHRDERSHVFQTPTPLLLHALGLQLLLQKVLKQQLRLLLTLRKLQSNSN